GVDAGAHHGPHHVVQEAVGAHLTFNQIPAAGDVEIVDGAHGGAGFGAHAAHGGEVVGAHEVGGGPLHDGLVQPLGIEPGAVDIKRIPDAGIVDPVGVLLFQAGADGVEFIRHLGGLDHHDVVGQAGVHRQGDPVAGDAGGGAEIGHVDLRVDAGVGAARAGALHRMAHHRG